MPHDAGFQKKVLITLLRLLDRPDGPIVLDDYPLDAPESEEETAGLSCPVRFDDQATGASDPLKTRFLREIQAMRPWYDMALEKRGRTSLGGSGVNIDLLGEYIYAYVKGEEPDNPLQDVDPSVSLKLAVEDLKGYYIEAVTAQPGQEDLSSKALKEWLWDKTTAGEVLIELIKTCSQSENEKLKMMGTHFIAPIDVMLKRGVMKPGMM
ncbi:MAG: hypothetical protein JW896_14620 [Deltaproteobacteria bacterium]|nr:hypothetical protein [Deltaproteobacteria bacterium]